MIKNMINKAKLVFQVKYRPHERAVWPLLSLIFASNPYWISVSTVSVKRSFDFEAIEKFSLKYI